MILFENGLTVTDESAMLFGDKNFIESELTSYYNSRTKQAIRKITNAPDWSIGVYLSRGSQVVYQYVIYNVIQSHTTQGDWTPDISTSLFRRAPVVISGENYPRWSQPIDAEDAYVQGEKVTHNGEDWQSDINANVWEPGVSQWTNLNVVVPPGYPAWAPWPGSGPTYQVGERVTHNGFNWEATVGNNVWEPGVFGWIQI